MGNRRSHKGIKIVATSITVALVVITAGTDVSPVSVATMGNVPIIDSLIKVLTFRGYTMDDGTYHANIKTPTVEGLENNKPLENSLNQKHIKESKKPYEQFEAEVAGLRKNGGGHFGVDSGYKIKCDDDAILSTGRRVVNTVDSSSATMKCDIIDKKNQALITLSSLFKDEQYAEVISENIRQQMINQNKTDPNKIYWIEGIDAGEGIELFQNISAEQNFYINTGHELVVSFDKYEAAPGYIGVVDFIIPIDLIRDLLVGNDYIR